METPDRRGGEGVRAGRPRALSLGVPTTRARVGACLALLLPVGALIAASAVVLSLGFEGVVQESHTLIERSQVGGWLLTGVCAAAGCLRQARLRGVFLLWWIGVLAMLAGVRELDFQVLVNPENIHMLGLSEDAAIRWKPSWWTGGETALGVKLAWALGLIGTTAAVLVPFALARFPWPSRLLRRDGFAWLLAVGFGLLAAGMVFDDLARPLAKAGYSVSIYEELIELAGVACVLAWTAWLGFGSPDLLLASERDV